MHKNEVSHGSLSFCGSSRMLPANRTTAQRPLAPSNRKCRCAFLADGLHFPNSSETSGVHQKQAGVYWSIEAAPTFRSAVVI
jgi:hypothetical protein